MDEFTTQSLFVWVRRYAREEEQFALYEKMYSFCVKHPDVLTRYGWPDIKQLAMRDA